MAVNGHVSPESPRAYTPEAKRFGEMVVFGNSPGQREESLGATDNPSVAREWKGIQHYGAIFKKMKAPKNTPN